MIRSLKESLEAGRDLSSAMRQHPEAFSPFYVAMVRVGEATGRLDEIFLQMFNHMEFERETRSRIKEALRYPSFVLIAMVVAVAIINVRDLNRFDEGTEITLEHLQAIVGSVHGEEVQPVGRDGQRGDVWRLPVDERALRGRDRRGEDHAYDEGSRRERSHHRLVSFRSWGFEVGIG